MLEPLIIDSSGAGWITLHRFGGDSFSFELPSGFSTDMIAQVLLAAGLVKQPNGDLITSTWTGCRGLGEAVLEILAYFDPPDRPSPELRRIRGDLIDAVPDDEVEALPMLSIAWLDWAIRQDVAESAGSSNPWQSDSITVDVAPIRRRRLAELLARARPQGQPAETGPRMAPSVRQRRSDRQIRTG